MPASRLLTLLMTTAAAIALASLLARSGDEPALPETVDGREATPHVGCAEDQAGCAAGEAGTPALLDADQVCPGAGYLCVPLTRDDEVRVIRWDGDTRVLRIRVPPPTHEPPQRARLLQQAAARGLRAWQDRPFALRIDRSHVPGDHDVVLRWVDTLADRGLGRTRTRWTFRNGQGAVEVEDLVLATRVPGTGREVSLEALELAAAHEMGHVLGLPHSDRERDVMYPENTSTRPTSRDYRTLEALYRLRNGAIIR